MYKYRKYLNTVTKLNIFSRLLRYHLLKNLFTAQKSYLISFLTATSNIQYYNILKAARLSTIISIMHANTIDYLTLQYSCNQVRFEGKQTPILKAFLN
jgi:hypothetical protein